MHPDGKSVLPCAEPLLDMCTQPCSVLDLHCSLLDIQLDMLAVLCASATPWHSAVFMFKFIDLSACTMKVLKFIQNVARLMWSALTVQCIARLVDIF